MRKMLLALTTVGLLAVPAGMAMAQSDTTEPAGPVPTCVDHEQDRDRAHSADQAMPGAQDQLRTQQRDQLQDGTCDGDCLGDQAQVQNQYQYRLQDQAQLNDGAMYRQGQLGEARNG